MARCTTATEHTGRSDSWNPPILPCGSASIQTMATAAVKRRSTLSSKIYRTVFNYSSNRHISPLRCIVANNAYDKTSSDQLLRVSDCRDCGTHDGAGCFS